MRCAIALLLCALAAPARAAGPPPTVAVMPFRDLSGQAPTVGEAIRETVTSDLKDFSGVRVIERANLDRVFAELNLQKKKYDLDPSSAVQVGKLLGATLIVAGGYQKAGNDVRLTARFVKVETGEIVGSAKVDGRASSFLRLQDSITEELLRSAGMIEKAKKVRARAPQRPQIKSMRTLEMYGEAVLAETDADRKRLLKAAVDEDAGFEYASRDLAALVARLQRYQAQADREKEKQLEALREEAKREADPSKRAMLEIRLCSDLMTARRYYELKAFARALASGPPQPSSPQTAGQPARDQMGLFYVIQAENALKERDAVLRDGEAFLDRYPGSQYFPSIKITLESIIRERREAEEGKAKVDKELARLSSEQKWNLCRVGHVYRGAAQRREAQRLFRACAEAGNPDERAEALQALIYTDVDLGDWTAMRRDLDALEKADKKTWQSMVEFTSRMVPIDG